jgi:protein tyrosine phosphatase
MIWDFSVVKIVMLCGLEEDGRLACDVYFPDSIFSTSIMTIGNDFKLVHIKTDKSNPFYWIRTI